MQHYYCLTNILHASCYCCCSTKIELDVDEDFLSPSARLMLVIVIYCALIRFAALSGVEKLL